MLSEGWNNEVLSAQGEGDDPNAPVFSALLSAAIIAWGAGGPGFKSRQPDQITSFLALSCQPLALGGSVTGASPRYRQWRGRANGVFQRHRHGGDRAGVTAEGDGNLQIAESTSTTG